MLYYLHSLFNSSWAATGICRQRPRRSGSWGLCQWHNLRCISVLPRCVCSGFYFLLPELSTLVRWLCDLGWVGAQTPRLRFGCNGPAGGQVQGSRSVLRRGRSPPTPHWPSGSGGSPWWPHSQVLPIAWERGGGEPLNYGVDQCVIRYVYSANYWGDQDLLPNSREVGRPQTNINARIWLLHGLIYLHIRRLIYSGLSISVCPSYIKGGGVPCPSAVHVLVW